jgi:hypothetical protein
MGASFSASVITPGAISAASPIAVIRAAVSGNGARPRIKRITVVIHGAAANSSVDCYRVPVGNIGTPNTSVLGQGRQSADVSVTNVDTAWSAAPTLPSGTPVPVDGATIAGTIGNGQIFSFDDFTLEPNTGLLLWAAIGAGQLRITPAWEE